MANTTDIKLADNLDLSIYASHALSSDTDINFKIDGDSHTISPEMANIILDSQMMLSIIGKTAYATLSTIEKIEVSKTLIEINDGKYSPISSDADIKEDLKEAKATLKELKKALNETETMLSDSTKEIGVLKADKIKLVKEIDTLKK